MNSFTTPPAASRRFRTVSIAGSPSTRSRSSWLLELAHTQLRRAGAVGASIAVRDLPAVPLVAADRAHPQLRDAVGHVLEADLVIVATPIYKAAYCGLLKLFLDLLPIDALRGKTVLPIATGGSPAHFLALDYALKPVLSALGAREIFAGLFTCDRELVPHETLGYVPDAGVIERLDRLLQPMVERAATHVAAPPVLIRCSN